MARSLRNSVYLLALVGGLTFFAGLVFASNPLPVPLSLQPMTATPAGLNSMVTFDARNVGTAANAGYYSKPVLISNNTLSGLGKGLLRRAVPVAAMIAAIEGAGWAIDALSGQIIAVPGTPAPGPVPSGGVYYIFNSQYFSAHGNAVAALMALRTNSSTAPHRHVANDGVSGPGSKAYCLHHPLWNSSTHLAFDYIHERVNETAFPVSHPWKDPVTAPVAATNAQVGQLVANNPSLARQALHNADGSVNRNPDVMAAAQALAAELAATDPVDQPDPVAEWDTGQQGGPNAGQGTAPEFPAFCAWASVVCDAITWAQDDQDDAPEDSPIDWIDPEAAVTWNSGLGAGSCPADASASFPVFGELTFPLSQFCALAELIRPLVFLAGALIAAMIIGGYRSAA